MKSCIVCKEPFQKGAGISFHVFPNNERKYLWIKSLKLSDDKVLKNTWVCSKHFKSSDFLETASLRKGRFLKAGAELSISISDSETISASSPSAEEVGLLTSRGRQGISVQLSVRQDSSSTLTGSEPEMQEPLSVGTKSTSSSDKENSPEIKQPPRKRFKGNPRYLGDVSTSDIENPVISRKIFKISKQKILEQRRKIHALRISNQRLKRKITDLNSLTQHLREKLKVTEKAETSIKASVPGNCLEIVQSLLKGPSKQKYSPELRAFALTLNFYSPKAYDYLRETFNNTLPHPKTLSKWYQSVNGAPGLTEEALKTLTHKVQDMKSKGHEVLCNLIMDEMSIKKQVEWTGLKLTGYVNIGIPIDSDDLEEATEVLVYMLVGVNGYWKIPVAYFFLNGVDSIEKANITTTVLEFIHKSGVVVTSFTFDGTPTNLKTAQELGANFSNVDNIISNFPHPITKENIYIYLDACHMLKLVRNTLANKKVITDGVEADIKWDYIEKLENLQSQEGLLAGTKLKRRHIQWEKEKMKVSLAAQTLSNSVANALLFAAKDLNLKEFKNVYPTVTFLKIFNNLFDIFNSKSLVSKYIFKRGVTNANYTFIVEYLNECKIYIKNLKLGNTNILLSRNHKGFLGFLINIESLLGMYNTYVLSPTPLLKYILTYKFSQDHLEIFFGAVRRHGGYNNNPSARQFESIYKKLLTHINIKSSTRGNVTPMDSTSILHCSSLSKNNNNLIYNDALNDIKFDEDHDYLGSTAWHLTTYQADVVSYIAGYVVKSISKLINCTKCLEILKGNQALSKLQIRKQYGALKNASLFVIKLCKIGEKIVKEGKELNIFKNKNVDNVLNLFVSKCISKLPEDIYNDFGNHVLDDDVVDGHAIQLIRLILKKYVTIRINHECKTMSEKSIKSRVRHQLTKAIIFQNQ